MLLLLLFQYKNLLAVATQSTSGITGNSIFDVNRLCTFLFRFIFPSSCSRLKSLNLISLFFVCLFVYFKALFLNYSGQSEEINLAGQSSALRCQGNASWIHTPEMHLQYVNFRVLKRIHIHVYLINFHFIVNKSYKKNLKLTVVHSQMKYMDIKIVTGRWSLMMLRIEIIEHSDIWWWTDITAVINSSLQPITLRIS